MRSYLYYASLSGLTAFYLTYTQALLPGLKYTGPSGLKTQDEISMSYSSFCPIKNWVPSRNDRVV